MNCDESVLILDKPVDTDAVDLSFGKRWGDQRIRLNSDHLAALQAGKCLALDIMNEYVVYLKLDDKR